MSAIEEAGESINVENIPVSREKIASGSVAYTQIVYLCICDIMITYYLH